MERVSSMQPGRLRVVIPGGSGELGWVLARHFQGRGHHVTVLTRSPYTAPWRTVYWDGERTGPWVNYLEGADVCIHLAGRSLRCRYDKTRREEIYRSRVGSTWLLNRVLAGLASPPRVWLNASTADIYRHTMDRAGVDWEMNEATGELGGGEPISKWRHAPESWNFATRVAKDAERTFFEENLPRTRKVALRSAVVMSTAASGMFAQLSRLVRLSLGGAQGGGRQFVSWIHEDDFARAVEFLVEREWLDGPVNLASPNPVRNRELMAGLREAWNVPNGFPIPTPLVELAALALQTQAGIVLKSRRVVPARLLEAGFRFEFPEWAEAAENLVRRWRARDE